ncbi:ABC transporter ATP-binding protein [Deferribacterales bacterium RsTz2092]|nr:ATP-binding protein [Deferribacterales bacterium]
MELICLKDIRLVRGDWVLALNALEISAGEKVAILGENGSGKTTVLQIIAGLLKASGQIELVSDGSVYSWHSLGAEERAKHLSYLPQRTDVLFNLNVSDIVRLRYGVPFSAARLEEVVNILSLAGLMSRRYSELSGGERRRVMLVRALLSDAPFVLLDEPTAPFDMRHTEQTMRYLMSLPCAVVASIHDINVAARYFTRFILLKEGKIIFDGGQLNAEKLEETYNMPIRTCGNHFIPA